MDALATDTEIRQWLLPNELSWMLSLLVYPHVLRLAYNRAVSDWGIRDYEAWTALLLGAFAAFELVVTLIVALHYALIQHRDLNAITTSTVWEGLICIPQALTAALAHLFFLRRARYLTASSAWITGGVLACILTTAIGGVGLGASVILFRDLEDAYAKEVRWANISMYGSCITDVLLSVILVWHLHKYRMTGSAYLREALQRIIFLAAECAGLTAVTSSLSAALYCSVGTKNNGFIVPYNLLPTFYALTVFWTLGVQEAMRKSSALTRAYSPPRIPVALPVVRNPRDLNSQAAKDTSLRGIHESIKIDDDKPEIEAVPVLLCYTPEIDR